MLKSIAYGWHILKARAVVAYALYCVWSACSYVTRRELCGKVIEDVLASIRHPFTKRETTPIYAQAKETYHTLYRNFFKDYKVHRKTPLANYVYVNIECPALGSYFSRIIGIAWLCEKLKLNVRFTFPDSFVIGVSNFFDRTILDYAKPCHPEKFAQLQKPLVDLTYSNKGILPSIWEEFAKRKISSDYGYRILSRLSIKSTIHQAASQWQQDYMKPKCIGVHYRRTDVVHERRVIKMEIYLAYLKQVVEDHYQIFACSDDARFITAIQKEFPGRVVAREITRSTDLRSLHRHEPYAGHQQRQDALIDILLLAKTERIYTLGSYLIDTVRFFNPAIEIISIDSRNYPGISNFLPIPKIHLIKGVHKQNTWKKAILAKGQPKHIERKRK